MNITRFKIKINWLPHSAVLLCSQPWYGDFGDVVVRVCFLLFRHAQYGDDTMRSPLFSL
jgi:hypothetical protein